ncbi:MAG TPA: hypothetical protein VL403_20420 [Candidatus Kryptonia bacterium]|nr:hypothetical protein [Candidatus Kryptonia bacterium]
MAWRLRLARGKSTTKSEPETAAPAPSPEPPQTERAPAPSPIAERSQARPAPTSAVGGVGLDSLRQKLLDLYGERVPRDVFSTQAVQLLSTAVSATAVALLAYDKRRDRLVLCAASGLSDAACEALGGGAGAPGWDIPMRGLSNRRISVIEAAHQNPFVPRSLVEVSPKRLTIASLPFFHGFTPVGVLVMFANKPHAFGDTQLQAVGQALKVCGLAFAELPRSADAQSAANGAAARAVADATPAPGSDAATERQRAADAQEIARLRTAFDEALWQHAKELAETRRGANDALNAEREQVAALGTKLAEASAERDRYASQLATIRAELATLADTRSALDNQSAEARRLKEALATATAELERTGARLAELQRSHAELVVANEAALRQHAEQQRVHGAERERDATTITSLRDRIAALEADQATARAASEALRAAHEQLRERLATAEVRSATLEAQLTDVTTSRDALAAQLADLRSAADTTMQKAATAEQTAARLQQQHAEQTAALTSERDALRRDLARTTAAADELRAALAAAQAERDAGAAAAALNASRLTQVEQTLNQLRAEHSTALAAAQQERERLTAELERWREQELAWTANLKQSAARADAAESERARVAESLAKLEQARGRSADQTARQLRAAEQAADALRAQHAELTSRYTALEAASAAVQNERDQLSALYAALRTEHQQGVAHWDESLTARDQQIAALRSQLEEAHSQRQSEVGEKSSHAKRLAKERDAANSALQRAEQALAEQSARLKVLEQELATTAANQTAVRGELAEVSARHEQEAGELRRQLADAQATLDASRRDYQTVAAERAAAADGNTALQRDLAAVRAELAATADRLARERAEAETANTQSRTGLDSVRAELSAAMQRIAKYDDDLAALRAQLNEQAAAGERERATHRDEVARLTAEWDGERSALQTRGDELERELQQTRKEHLALAEALAADEAEPALEIERHIIPGADSGIDELVVDDAAVESSIDAPRAAVSTTVAIIDGELAASMVAEVAQAGWDAVACEPTEAAIEQLARQSLRAIAINVLAGTNGWQLVRALREQPATRSVPLLLYAKLNDANGFYFGPADCVLWPSEAQRVLDTLARLKPRAKRVLAMSTDIDIVATVREQLTGAGLSAAVMLDGKQALDLLPSVRPDAVVLHLSPACNDVFRTIAGLRAATTASLPIVFLLDQQPSTRDATFLTGGARTLVNKGTFGATALVEALATLTPDANRSDAPTDDVIEPRPRRAAVGASDGWVG